ncbi:MAG: hypothetical protein GJ671_10230 [Alteromonadaceae bacterium]|nr:hypothetical protein [Alteromonadaceae bacterium]
MQQLILIMIGIAFGIALYRYACIKRWDLLHITIFLPAIYVGFALFSSTPTQSVIEEMFFGMPIFMLVGISHMQEWATERKEKVAVAVWLYHGFYDYVHHWLVVNDGVSWFYPDWCLGIDLAVAVCLAWSIYQAKQTKKIL